MNWTLCTSKMVLMVTRTQYYPKYCMVWSLDRNITFVIAIVIADHVATGSNSRSRRRVYNEIEHG